MANSTQSISSQISKDLENTNTCHTSSSQKSDVYSKLTQRIVELLEKNPKNWMKPWVGGPQGLPINFSTQKAYRGMNLLYLGLLSNVTGSNLYITYNQAKALGGNIKKGAKGFPVFYFDVMKKTKSNKDGSETAEEIFFCRSYTVFSALDTEGVKGVEQLMPKPQINFNPIEECEKIVSEYKDCPTIIHDQIGRAFHRRSTNEIHLPAKNHFLSEPEYYSTLFHEMGHSTGTENRLNRPELVNYHENKHNHSKEELIAEITACFLCGLTGIENKTIDNSVAYINGWIQIFKNDPKILFSAAQKAQKAVDYILGKEV